MGLYLVGNRSRRFWLSNTDNAYELRHSESPWITRSFLNMCSEMNTFEKRIIRNLKMSRWSNSMPSRPLTR